MKGDASIYRSSHISRKGRRVSYLKKRETRPKDTCLPFRYQHEKNTNNCFSLIPSSPRVGVTLENLWHNIQTGEEVGRGEPKQLEIFGRVVWCGFKIW
jgi:hypothetical protein